MKGSVHFVNPDTPPFVSPQRGNIILDINIQDSAPTDYLLQSSSKTRATRYHPVYIPMTRWYGKEEYTGF